MKFLCHPGLCVSECYVVDSWTCRIQDVSPLMQEDSSVLTNWRRVAGFESLCRSLLTESLRSHLSQPSCVMSGLGHN